LIDEAISSLESVISRSCFQVNLSEEEGEHLGNQMTLMLSPTPPKLLATPPLSSLHHNINSSVESATLRKTLLIRKYLFKLQTTLAEMISSFALASGVDAQDPAKDSH
jgi:hypothetical protein